MFSCNVTLQHQLNAHIYLDFLHKYMPMCRQQPVGWSFLLQKQMAQGGSVCHAAGPCLPEKGALQYLPMFYYETRNLNGTVGHDFIETLQSNKSLMFHQKADSDSDISSFGIDCKNMS